MKNVILVAQDRFDIPQEERLRIIKTILEDDKFQIELLIINPADDKEYYLQIPGVNQVMSSLELEYTESMQGLNYDDILKYKEFQTDIETMAYRMMGDYQLSKYYYYESLCFWLRFFHEHQVDVIIHTKAYHGYMHDCCDIVANKHGVKSFHMIPIGYHHTFCIYCYHQILSVPVRDIDHLEYLLQSDYDKRGLPPSKEKKNHFRRILYRLGGNLLEDFVFRVLKWDWEPRRYRRKRAKLLWSDKFFGYMKLQDAKRFMESFACEPNYEENYICYFLHLEPEASIQSSTILPNQLVILKMLSETLPEGWHIYVKEHPAQYKFNNDRGYSHMFDAPLFKTRKFYQKLNSIPHVKIIDLDVGSEELMEHTQAVASILGTSLFESVLKKKPVLLFSDLNPVAYLHDAFSIHSFQECEEAMKKIERGFQPDYSDADEVIGQYVFQGEHMTETIMGLLNREFGD